MQIIDFKVNFLKNFCLCQSKKLTPAPAKNTAKQKIPTMVQQEANRNQNIENVLRIGGTEQIEWIAEEGGFFAVT